MRLGSVGHPVGDILFHPAVGPVQFQTEGTWSGTGGSKFLRKTRNTQPVALLEAFAFGPFEVGQKTRCYNN